MGEEIRSIAISGEGGTGKTSVAGEVANVLGWNAFGAGELFRDWSEHNGMETLGAKPGQDAIHNLIDGLMVEKLEEGSAVVEGRVAAVLAVVNEIPGVAKVLLTCEPDLRYERIFARDYERYTSVAQVAEVTGVREEENHAIFTGRYGGVSYRDPELYDLVHDNTAETLPETVAAVLGFFGLG